MGALVGVVATDVFDLRVHIGIYALTGVPRFVCAAIGGAIAACALAHGIQQI